CCFLVKTWLIYPVNNFQLPEAALPDHNRAVTGVLPSANDLLLKETNLNATKDALELEKRLFDEEKSDWTTNTNAQKKKQALIQRGATIMFRMHRLEDGLLQTAQQELDVINRVQAAATSRANTISDRLTEEFDKLTEKVNVKSAELDTLVSRAQAHVSHFSSAAEAIGLERNDALDEARSEAQATSFEKLREREKANLAEGHARVEHSQLVKKEMARARVASVDAKEAALGKLQAARWQFPSRHQITWLMAGTTSSINGIEGGRAGGLQKSRMPSTRHAAKQKPPRLATFPTFPLLNP
ncbi:hypothetical protein JB92DRAFT_2847204, partial [Gautieria morchelliformis]